MFGGRGGKNKAAVQPLAFFGNMKNAAASAAAKATKTASPSATKTTTGSFDKWRSWSEERSPAPKTTLSDGLAITPALGKAISSVASTAAHAHAKPAAKPAAAAAKQPTTPPPPPPPPGPESSLLADLGTRQLPDGMHALLRSVAQAQLQAWLDAPAGAGGGFSPDAAATKAQATARTTTDISAAVELVAAVVPGDSYPDKHPRAVLSLVACETERSVSWSRLEGLFAHWAVRSGAAGSAWQAAPYGWRSAPALSHDAGGGAAWQSAFERHTVSMAGAETPTPIYGLLLEVPVSGPLATAGAGPVFVLKSGDPGLSSSTQTTRWLREQPSGDAEARDFFVEVAKLPKLERRK
jgi:hypothetical protein